MSHTPGPWTLTLNWVGMGKWRRIFSAEITASDGTVVAVISDINVREQHQPACLESDARLMTAAPELLEACRTIVEDARRHAIAGRAVDLCAEAYAKAIGGTPEEDARLMMADPDLLEACQATPIRLNSFEDVYGDSILRYLRYKLFEAITKAAGGAP